MNHPKRKIRSFDWSRRLVELAEQAAAIPDQDDITLVEHQLADLVARVVTRGSDQPLHQAIEQLDERHHHDAANLVEFWADEAATEIGIELGDVVKTQGVATAFLIPLVLVTESSHAVPLTLPTDVTRNRIIDSLRKYGIVGPTTLATVFPGLYRPEDLPESWAIRRHWLEQFVTHVADSTRDIPQPEFGPPLLTSGGLGLTLRFLIGLIVTADTDDDDDGLMLTGYNIDEEDDDQDQAAVGQWISDWRDEFISVMEPVMKLTSVIAGIPDVWANALEFGQTLVNHVAIDTLVRALLGQELVDIRDAIAAIEWDPEIDAWGITLRVDSLEAGPFYWTCAQNPEVELTQIMENLRDWGVGRMAIDERGLMD